MRDKKQKYLSLIERARQNYEYKKHANFNWCDECKKSNKPMDLLARSRL